MSKKKYPFNSVTELDQLIEQYFTTITSGDALKKRSKAESAKQKTKPDEHPTISGLAFYLGFNSREDFEACESKGKFSAQLKRATLRIMADYEKKLHVTSSTGAIFALRNLGWNDKAENKQAADMTNTKLNIKIIHTGPPLASSEKEVVM